MSFIKLCCPVVENQRPESNYSELNEPAHPSNQRQLNAFRIEREPLPSNISRIWENNRELIVKTVQATNPHREWELLRECDHPNIVQMIRYFQEDSSVRLYFEAAECSLLHHCIINNSLREEEIRSYFIQMVAAVSYLHKKNIMHRDIKLDNFLVFNGGEKIKLADFGFAKRIETRAAAPHSPLGSYHYVAPEVLKKERGERKTKYNYQADLYSLGISLYALSYNKLPYDGENQRELLLKVLSIKSPPPLEGRSNELRDLISKLLEPDPEKRPQNCEEILAHPWMHTPEERQFSDECKV